MKAHKRVLFNKISAILWVVAGCMVFVLGWQESVLFVIIASVYANVKTDWGTAEAADDHLVIERLDRIEALLRDRT